MINYRDQYTEITYITSVDKPCYFSIRCQLPIHITSKFTVLPAVIDVHYSNHIPLSDKKTINITI